MVEEMYQQESKEVEGDAKERDRNPNNAQTSTPPSSTTVGAAGAAAASTPAPASTTITTTPAGKRSEINARENDPSFIAINRQCFSENQARQCAPTTTTTATIITSPSTTTIITSPPTTTSTATATPITTTSTTNNTATEVASPISQPFTTSTTHDSDIHHRLLAGIDDTCHRGSIVAADYGTSPGNTDIGATLIRFGTTAGDVSLTLGLRHAGNMPDKSSSFSVTDFGGC